jgi:glycosyltransferase involved in cell wall biosynthesis
VAVICTDCRAGPSELIHDGVNGRLVPVDDVAALARVMAELMAQPAVREALGREARRVVKDYGQDTIMERWQACVLPAYAPLPAAGMPG